MVIGHLAFWPNRLVPTSTDDELSVVLLLVALYSVDHFIVNWGFDVDPGGSRAFLTLQAEGRAHDPGSGAVQIGIGGETISGCVTVEATKASHIGKKMINTPVIINRCVSHRPIPRRSTMPCASATISNAPAFRYI